ncbi:homeobox protein cut-like protein [Cladophialophora psammophila CBS 110553]|uniref:Protein CASP n=1 Tax=Cladophialophora psammophila CBS 110553 TaxID=1182543 RepID=W9WDQ7_9EURO|nr:homeobox protein cut-like protein [Cladophialophora psammophila CBS 110553]EXJ66242.1 homeobox protein cut-like protein [Cladophialophora psammophila CBS 110553]
MDAMVISEVNDPRAEEDGPRPEDIVQRSPGEAENKFQKAIAAWRNIDLSSLMSQLDSTASEIVAQQRDALLERKELAQKTKDFRKLEDTAKLTEYKSLLKAYQTFIDLITGHGKTSSSAFLQLYQSLSEAPDPFPLLEASVDSLVASEDTVPKLNAENQQLLARVSKLTAQLEETEQKLQDESKARKDAEAGTGTLVQEIEAKWENVLEEKQSNWTAKERFLEEKVENQDRLLKELKASYEVSQRLQDGSAEAATSKAAAAELEMMTNELEKTTARLAEIEARNEQLRVDLARTTSQSTENHNIEEDPSFLRLQSENSSLLRKIESARFERETEKRDWDNKLRQADRQRSQLASENEELRTKVSKWSDYEDLRRELDTLRSIELSIGDDEDGDDAALNGSAENGTKQSLEQLLLARNKKLANELTLLRVSHQDLQRQLEDLQEELSRTNAELEKSQKLSSTLENDLMRVQEEAANALPSSGMSVAGTYVSRHPTGSLRRGRASPTSSIISGYDMQPRSNTLESLRAGDPVGGGSGILPMIQAQRDRFKQKNQQLEEELSKTYTTVTSLRQEVASLQKDNLNLYEKTRYISAYNRSPATSSSAYSGAPAHTAIHMDDTTTSRWKSQYEANISPFAAFRGREAARAYQRMSFPERIIFSLTRVVLATRTSRNLFAGYCVALHVLVFVMLYWMGTIDVDRNVVHLGEAAAAAVGGAGLRSPESHDPDWHQEEFG